MENSIVAIIVGLAVGYLVRRYYRKFKVHTGHSSHGGECCGGAACSRCGEADTCSGEIMDPPR
jgi:hypothetical protein